MKTTFITTKIYCLVTRVNHTWGPQIGIFVQLSFLFRTLSTGQHYVDMLPEREKLSHVLLVHNKQLIVRLVRSRFTSIQ